MSSIRSGAAPERHTPSREQGSACPWRAGSWRPMAATSRSRAYRARGRRSRFASRSGAPTTRRGRRRGRASASLDVHAAQAGHGLLDLPRVAVDVEAAGAGDPGLDRPGRVEPGRAGAADVDDQVPGREVLAGDLAGAAEPDVQRPGRPAEL